MIHDVIIVGSGPAGYTAAIYAARWRNVQSDQFLPSGLAYVVNVGDGADKGFEVEANWRSANARRIAVQSNLENVRNKLAYTELRAPDDGIVSAIGVAPDIALA